MEDINKYKPAVSRNLLLFLAGLVWIGVGIMLMFLAVSWLAKTSLIEILVFSSGGILLALLVHHFGFLKIVDKNLKRILQMKGKKCVFAFIPWKSYLIIAIMVTFGILLRHSAIPKKDLAILYIGIGLALVLSSVRYIRVFLKEFKNRSLA